MNSIKTASPSMPILSLGGFAAILLFGLLASSPASAQLYQWTDSNGKNVISDSPPPGQKTKQISKGGSKETVTPNSADKEPKKPDSKQQKPAKSSAEQAADEKRQAEIREYCESARSRLTELDSGMRIGAIDPKGERYILNDEQKNTEIAKLRRGMAEAKCS